MFDFLSCRCVLDTTSCDKKSLKILKGWSESVNRRTDNAIAKRKGTINNDLQNITLKTKDVRVIRTPLKTGGERRCSVRITSSCCTSGTGSVNLVTNQVISHGILIGTTRSEIPFQLREIYSIYGCCWNVVTYKWKFTNSFDKVRK